MKRVIRGGEGERIYKVKEIVLVRCIGYSGLREKKSDVGLGS